MATVTISLSDPLKDWAERQTREGEFGDVSDYVGDLIRKDRERRQWIEDVQKLIDEGLASGVSTRTMDEIMADARARAGVDSREL